jgi:hypothetical protein
MDGMVKEINQLLLPTFLFFHFYFSILKMNTSKIYSGLATTGQLFSIFRAVVATIVSLGLIGYGIYILWVNWEYSEDKNGGVLKDSVCTNTTFNGRQSQSCNTTFSFKDSTGKSYTATQTSMTSYKKGDTVVVFYKDSDPIGTCQLNFWAKSSGYLFIGGGVLFAALSWGWVYLVEKYKPLAAFSGVKGIFNLATKL